MPMSPKGYQWRPYFVPLIAVETTGLGNQFAMGQIQAMNVEPAKEQGLSLDHTGGTVIVSVIPVNWRSRSA